MAAIGDYLYAGTWFYGMWRAKLSDLYAGLLSTPDLKEPSKSSLCQNNPNPFYSSTEIRYKVASSGPVLIEVFDLSGKTVTTLVDEIKPPGEYSVRFQPDRDSNLPGNGIYYYRLTDKSSTQTGKMIFLR
jgi:hypothetical protein